MYINKQDRQDNVYVKAEMVPLESLTLLPVTNKFKNAIISEGKIVNLVSDRYGLLDNHDFYPQVESKLIMADVEYTKRSLNNGNAQFKVDYILKTEDSVGNGKDVIKPMLSFVNSYDSSNRTSGQFGVYRQVCSNGLHVADYEISFNFKHTKNNNLLILPNIDMIIKKFMESEYYVIRDKFRELSKVNINDIDGFIREICDRTNVFGFQTSVKNPMPSKLANEVARIMISEVDYLDIEPNLWIGYNAFNEVINNLKTGTFDQKRIMDSKIFNAVCELN